MVWDNLLTGDMTVSHSYENGLKTMMRMDSLNKEIIQYSSLIQKLLPTGQDDFMTHAETGVVYDMRILKDNVNRLEEELNALDN
jgi:hypothetical protein